MRFCTWCLLENIKPFTSTFSFRVSDRAGAKSSTGSNPAKSASFHHHHQPDLVKETGSATAKAATEADLAEKRREFQKLRSQVQYNAKAFDALAVTLNYVTTQVR